MSEIVEFQNYTLPIAEVSVEASGIEDKLNSHIKEPFQKIARLLMLKWREIFPASRVVLCLFQRGLVLNRAIVQKIAPREKNKILREKKPRDSAIFYRVRRA